MSAADELIENAKRIRQRLRHPPNAVIDHGIDLTRKSTAHKGDGPIPDAPIKKILTEPAPIFPEIYFRVTFPDILDVVSAYYDVSVEDLKGSSRKAHISYARFVVVYLSLRFLVKKSLKSIGNSLQKDHTSIIHARNRINGILAANSVARAKVSMIENHIETTYNYRPAVPAFGQFSLALQSGPSPQIQEVHGLAVQRLGLLA